MVAKRFFVIAMGDKSFYICLFLTILFFSHLCAGEDKGNFRPVAEKSKTSSTEKRKAVVRTKVGKAFKDSLVLKDYPKSLKRSALYKAGDKINISYATLESISKKRNTRSISADVSKSSLTQNKLKNNSEANNSNIPEWLAKLNKKNKKNSTSTENDPVRGIEYISFVINQHSSEIQDCYHDYLKISPTIRGRLVVRISVNTKGQVDQVTIKESDIKDNEFKNRIIKIIKKWDNLGQGNLKNQVYLQEYVFGE